MKLIEIKALSNGGHRNQESDLNYIPEGFAMIPDDMETPNFPFGDVVVEEINGVMTVTRWTPGVVPEPVSESEPEETITLQLTKEQYNKLMSLLA